MNDELIDRIRSAVLFEIEGNAQMDDRLTSSIIDECLEQFSAGLSLRERLKVKKDIFNSLRRYDVISELLDNPEISEIMVNGPDSIFYEKGGQVYEYENHFRSTEILDNLVQQIVAGVNRQINEASPIVAARLPDGSRVHCIVKPVALDGPVISIRKFSQSKYDMEGLIAIGSISREAADYLKTLIEARYNIFICGGTGSGKTTLLNSLSGYIGSNERIITIEDSAELQITGCKNLVRLETRNSSREGTEAITIRDLIKSALRMRPDRIIVGEVRGEEVIDMLQAMNTGHDGSLSTGHANSPRDMLSRLETMALMGMDMPLMAIRGQISSAIDILVQVARLRDGSRRVVSIDEVMPIRDGEIELHNLFEFVEEAGEENGKVQGSLIYKREELAFKEKLVRAGKKLANEQ